MKIAFTLCSTNYLAQAKTLGDSVLLHNPEYKFVIGLVDKIDESIDPSFFEGLEILEVEKINISDFREMCKRYDIVELNTSVKPFYMDYLFKRDENVDSVIYFDPDIVIYDKFVDLEKSLADNNIVLTPHMLTAVCNAPPSRETPILKAGIYNLGFIATRRSPETARFLEWWMDRLVKGCLVDSLGGMFVDQLWVNLAPVYFEKVFILKHPGYNVAYWNLYERTVSVKNNKYYINDFYPLVFFHYSGFSPNKPNILSKYDDSYTFDERKDLIPLFDEYKGILRSNKYDYFKKLSYYYEDKSLVKKIFRLIFSIKLILPSRLRKSLKEFVRKLISFLKKNF